MFGLRLQARNPVTGQAYGTGWLPPVVDPRDYTEQHRDVAPHVEKLKLVKVTQTPGGLGATTSVDLRAYCSPIENQGQLGSCSANAAVGIVEYFERRAFGNYVDGSRLFVYKATRNLLGLTGDTGAWLRNTMGALVLCGVAPERYWPYTDASPDFDQEPPPFIYAIADNYEAVKYFAHDPIAKPTPKAQVIESVKKYLVAGVPSMLGFFGFGSAFSADDPAAFPVPCDSELQAGAIEWGHAVVAVGYDDKKAITNKNCNKTSTGAFLIRNSWGTSWGNAGYGWLPYDYVTLGIALDLWSLISQKWVDTGKFGL
jgi:C1A family cysteine protease